MNLLLKARDSLGEVSADSELFRFYLQGISSGIAVTASLVLSRDQHKSDSGTSDDLSWPEDRSLLSALRRNSEIVLTTGKTARAERIRMPKTSKLAIVSRNQNIEGTRLERNNPDLYLLSGLERSFEYFDDIRSIGYTKIHCEYGPESLFESWQAGEIELITISAPTPTEPKSLGQINKIFEIELGIGWVAGFARGVATTLD